MCFGPGHVSFETGPELDYRLHLDQTKQISTIFFSNSLVVKIGDSALYVLFESYRKTGKYKASRSMLFSKASRNTARVDCEIILL